MGVNIKYYAFFFIFSLVFYLGGRKLHWHKTESAQPRVNLSIPNEINPALDKSNNSRLPSGSKYSDNNRESLESESVPVPNQELAALAPRFCRSPISPLDGELVKILSLTKEQERGIMEIVKGIGLVLDDLESRNAELCILPDGGGEYVLIKAFPTEGQKVKQVMRQQFAGLFTNDFEKWKLDALISLIQGSLFFGNFGERPYELWFSEMVDPISKDLNPAIVMSGRFSSGSISEVKATISEAYLDDRRKNLIKFINDTKQRQDVKLPTK